MRHTCRKPGADQVKQLGDLDRSRTGRLRTQPRESWVYPRHTNKQNIKRVKVTRTGPRPVGQGPSPVGLGLPRALQCSTRTRALEQANVACAHFKPINQGTIPIGLEPGQDTTVQQRGQA